MKKLLIAGMIWMILLLSTAFSAAAAGAVSAELPVTIDSGGTAVIVTQVNCPIPAVTALTLEDGEEGSFQIDFAEEGSYAYTVMIMPDERDITFDTTVYAVSINVKDTGDGLIAETVIYNKATDLKLDRIHFKNTPEPPTEKPSEAPTKPTEIPTDPSGSTSRPKTGDDNKMELYFLIAMLAAAGLFVLSIIYTMDTNKLTKKK